LTWQSFGPVPQVARQRLVISRHWNNPTVEVTVDQDKIAIFLSASDFAEAVGYEFRLHPANLITRKRFLAALQQAVSSAIEKAKEASTEAM
jgi:hypothetical protein